MLCLSFDRLINGSMYFSSSLYNKSPNFFISPNSEEFILNKRYSNALPFPVIARLVRVEDGRRFLKMSKALALMDELYIFFALSISIEFFKLLKRVSAFVSESLKLRLSIGIFSFRYRCIGKIFFE